MPALFTLPKQIPLSSAGLLLPGAKLTFSQTGTSTLQNTYQDVLLATPHANPVVADASGIFAPIYLDPSLPNYRVKLTTSADVLIYQVDGVPVGITQAQIFRLAHTAPELILEQTGASANNGKWKIKASAEQLAISALNDAESIETALLTFSGRAGSTVQAANFATTFLQSNAENVSIGPRGASVSDQSVNNTATLQDSNITLGNLAANKTYRLTAFLQFYGLGAEGVKWKFTATVAGGGIFYYSGIVNSAAVSGRTDTSTTIAHATISASAAAPDVIQVSGFVKLTAIGTLKLQFAQNSATVTNTRLASGSLIELVRLN